jgi:hypothetical protein
MLTSEIVRQLLGYDSTTGVFTWKERSGQAGIDGGFNRKYAGTIAGRSTGTKYDSIAIYGTRYYSHRVAWLYMTGEFPPECIDHINGDTRDNRFSNLREATTSQNGFNAKRQHRNRCGLKGVCFVPKYSSPYRATLRIDGKNVILGHFDTAEEAHAAYVEAAKKYHGEFARAA